MKSCHSALQSRTKVYRNGHHQVIHDFVRLATVILHVIVYFYYPFMQSIHWEQ